MAGMWAMVWGHGVYLAHHWANSEYSSGTFILNNIMINESHARAD